MKRHENARKTLALLFSALFSLSGIFEMCPISAKAENGETVNHVYFLDTTCPETANLYAWGAHDSFLGDWPGTECSNADDIGAGFYKISLPEAVSTYADGTNLIFNHSGGSTDYYFTDAAKLFGYNGNFYATATEAVETYRATVKASDTFYYYNKDAWEDVYLYAWGNYGDCYGGWPGTEATQAPEMGNNWYKVAFPDGADFDNTGINIIFNNGSTQYNFWATSSTDVFACNGTMYSTASAAETAISAKAGFGGSSATPIPTPTPSPTSVHFLNSGNWSNVYAYAYSGGSQIGEDWPGCTTVSEPDVQSNDWRNIEIAASNFNIIINDNSDSRVEASVTGECYMTGDGGMYPDSDSALKSVGRGDQTQTTTLYYYNNRNWNTVNGYVYVNDKTFGKGWPGTRLSAASEIGAGWYKITVPRLAAADSTFNIIFNDGSTQLDSIFVNSNERCYVCATAELFATSEEVISAAGSEQFDDGCESGANASVFVNKTTLNFTRYEAENAHTNGTVLANSRTYVTDIASEAGARSAVVLDATGEYVEFTLSQSANALVLRYSIPDSADGVGNDTTLAMSVNGTAKGNIDLTSKYSWVYGSYPYNNDVSGGRAHRFFDETRMLLDGIYPAGTVIRLENTEATAFPVTVDFIECENVPAPLTQPENSLSVVDYGAVANDGNDDYSAFVSCIEAAKAAGKSVWIPMGTFNLTDKRALNVNHVTINGAGMWYTNLVGEGVSFNYGGTCKFSDFAMTGVATCRNDSDDLAAFEGKTIATNVAIENIWIEHVKVGVWSYNTNQMVIQGCRIRNTYADGINLCSYTNNTIVRNNSVRNTGDDGIAIWPWLGDCCNNTIENNLVELPMLANGIAIYGGNGNKAIGNTVCDTINNGSGICLGTDYVTENGFTGKTTVSGNKLYRCGSYHTDYNYPVGALWIWATNAKMQAEFVVENNDLYDTSYEAVLIDCYNDISGLTIKNIRINGNVTDGIMIRGDENGTKTGAASYANITGSFSNKKVNNLIPGKFTLTEIVESNNEAANNTNIVKSIAEKISDLKQKKIDDIREEIKKNIALVEEIRNMENQYMRQNNITVSWNVESKLSKIIKSSSISVTGAGLNAAANSALTLEFKTPAKQERINSAVYKNAIQIDIKLNNGDTEMEDLSVPVTIIMDAPTGLNRNKLVILHFDKSGKYELIRPTFTSDGKMMFSVTHFSTFVFAESDKSPKTGENGNAWSIVMIMSGLALLGLLPKRIFAKRA